VIQGENGVSVLPFFMPGAMTNQSDKNVDRSENNRLFPDDQKKVDEFVARGVNSVPRKPFKPLRLMLILIAIVTILSVFSQFLAQWAGIS